MRKMQRGAKTSTRGGSESVARGPLSLIMVFSRLSTPLYGWFSGKCCTPRLCRILHCQADGGGQA